ncbi:PilZ domain-containing protein [Butyrivibrio sp. CB08]|uniref:PilZ domain-containing protein n=1 Tax=Butyrivibrio sp. CB08 TaxID=2364879 RepID=UPI000EA87442|nr:PilZ domain-containing protein [Butyrivibrio sp. CB08]RKM57551.1 PilZ domain-containing protein [Butyrivibrio sp. CB08]
MEERRQINRVAYSANSVIVDRETQEKFYGQVKNISPLGIAIEVSSDTPKLLGKDVVVVAETIIMYADVIREDEKEDGSRIVAFSSKKFTNEVLTYLFEHIGAGIEE